MIYSFRNGVVWLVIVLALLGLFALLNGALPKGVLWYVSLLISWLPFLALVGVWIYLSRRSTLVNGSATDPTSETALLKQQVEELKRDIERLKGSQVPPS